MTSLNDIVKKIEAQNTGDKRLMVAVSGPPASGKSTLAEMLGEKIANSIVVPMDGFHLDNSILDEMGARDRKGAPHTFDGEGFVDMVKRIAADDGVVSIPEFVRSLDKVVAGDSVVTPNDRIILVEGNYLMLDSAPWCELEQYFDFSISLNPGIEILKTRLTDRWLAYDHTPEQAKARALSNDIPNAEYIIRHSKPAQLELKAFKI